MPKKLTPFHYWTQKVLPEIYDDSLSYYELLNKVVGYLNEAMSNVNTLSDNVTEIYRAVVDLQKYVDEHLDETVEEKIEEYFRTHEFVGNVSVNQILTQGVKIGSINVDGVITELFAPEGGVVSVDQVVSSGTEIAGVTVNGVRTPIFSKSVSVTGELTAGTKIGSITVGGEAVELFAPEGGGSTVSFTPVLTTGVRIGTISIDGVETALFAPSGGGSGAVDSVNGKIGDVVLNAEDVGALPDTVTTLPNPNKLTFTGAVSAEYDGSGAVSVEIPQGGSGAVESVNGKTGAVVLNAEDVGALADSVSALPNPHKLTFTGAVSAEYDGSGAVSVEIPQGGAGAVESVNGKTGAVVLAASDVSAVKSSWGTSEVGKFLVVGSNGVVTTQTLATWSGGSY